MEKKTCRPPVSSGQKENTTTWLWWVGLGLTAWLLQDWKGSEKWNCCHAGPWGACWCCWEAAVCVGYDPWAPGWGEGPGTMTSFMEKLYSANPRFECLNLSPLGKSQGAGEGLFCLALCGTCMAWGSSREFRSPSAWGITVHLLMKESLGLNIGGGGQTLWIYSVRHPNRFWT